MFSCVRRPFGCRWFVGVGDGVPYGRGDVGIAPYGMTGNGRTGSSARIKRNKSRAETGRRGRRYSLSTTSMVMRAVMPHSGWGSPR